MNDEKLNDVTKQHKPARRNHPCWRVEVRGLDETWQADVVDLSNYSTSPKDYNYILTVIAIFSKFLLAVIVQWTTQMYVAAAMKSIFEKDRLSRKNWHVVRGKKFYNKKFEELMKQYAIILYSTYSTLKASICENLNRTLKKKMWIKFSLRGN